jgi:hypothetical protein
MPDTLTFSSWERSLLFDRAVPQGARLGSSLALRLSDVKTGQQALGDAPFALLAAADVAGLKPGAIKHMAPAPFARDAETTKFVHIDLWEKDLPWRYTPQVNSPQLRPWLVLLVGTGEEIQVAGGIANVKDSVLIAHNLQDAHLWAHTQWDRHTTIARILSPRKLAAQSEYVAVLVPAFNQDGQEMWTVAGAAPNQTVQRKFGSKGVLAAFHFWRFWTAEAGDFETLAAALHVPPAGDAGKAKLHYLRPVALADGSVERPVFALGGAITSMQPDLGLIRPEQMTDRQLLDALVALQPLPGGQDPEQLTTDEKRALLESLRAPVLDRIGAARRDLDTLNDEIVFDDATQKAIGLPHYGRPWLPDPDAIPTGWPADLNDDPRFRGVTGLGTWMGVEAQESLMDAAVKQAGALREASQRIGYLALGLWAAGRLWDRRLPADKNERLRILGPLMGRMTATDGGLALDRVTSGSSPLTPALFSSAAQRLLRDRSAHTRHISGANGGIDRSAALDAANRPERQPERAPAGLPHFDAIAEQLGLDPLDRILGLDDAWIEEVLDEIVELALAIIDKYQRNRRELIQAGRRDRIPDLQQEFVDLFVNEVGRRLQDRLPEREMPCEGHPMLEQIGAAAPGGFFAYYVQVLENDGAEQRFFDNLRRALRRCMASRACLDLLGHIDVPDPAAFCDDLLDSLPTEPQPEQKSIDLGLLSDKLHAALDPRLPDAPARVRLCSRLAGIDCSRLIPPEFPIGLDYPTWDLLRQYDKEWLLPGASALEQDSITALQTNPAFIDAYMVGINTQFMSEMRWRDLAVARTSTPLRMFWGQVNYATQQRQADIQPLGEWAKEPGKPIGDLTHQTIQPSDDENASGSRLVVAFRTDLFRRYPATLVYLVRPDPDVDTDEPPHDENTPLNILLKAPPQLDMPPSVHPVGSDAWKAEFDAWRKAARKYIGPSFAGTLTPEITFFSFDVTPSKLDEYWLVLDEPPAELRFRNDQPQDTTNSATFAKSTLDVPTRVAWSGAELERQANNP